MGFTGATGAKGDAVLPRLDPFAARQADPTLDAFKFAKTQKIVWIISTVLCGPHRHLVIFARKCRQLQRLQMIASRICGVTIVGVWLSWGVLMPEFLVSLGLIRRR
jgi:hypothetical protein